jgi:hypothetical protein
MYLSGYFLARVKFYVIGVPIKSQGLALLCTCPGYRPFQRKYLVVMLLRKIENL